MKKILFIISIILIISLVLSSCANKAGEAQKGTETESESNVPSEEFHPIIDAFADRPKLAKSDFKPLSEMVFESEYERIACEYFENFGKALFGVTDDFDVYQNTIGSLGAEEKSRVTEDILNNDVVTHEEEIEDLNDYLSSVIKRRKLKVEEWPGYQAINYDSKIYIEKSNSNENFARVKIHIYSQYDYVDYGEGYGETICDYDVYMCKYGETWLIYNSISSGTHEDWQRENDYKYQIFDYKPLSEIVFESDYERVAFDYVVNYEKTFTGAKDEFDVYANTIGSLSAEEKSRVIEDIIQKDLKADVAQIEDLNDFLAFCLKRQQTTYPQSYNSLPVINYGCDACVLHSRGNEYIACIEVRLYEHFNYIDSPDEYADEGIYYVIYLYKYGDTWLIYNVVSNDYWRRESYRGGDYEQLYEELVEPKE